MTPAVFATPAPVRAWLAAHHEAAPELWVEFFTKGSGRPSITWPDAVNDALCIGWIGGVRTGIDDAGDAIRFTPHRLVPQSQHEKVIDRIVHMI